MKTAMRSAGLFALAGLYIFVLVGCRSAEPADAANKGMSEKQKALISDRKSKQDDQ